MAELPTIAGAAEATYTRHPPPDTTTPKVLADAAVQALANAKTQANEIDGLAVSSFSLAPDHAIDLAWRLGLHLTWLMQDTNGGASGVNMVQHAVRAIEAGDATTILVLAGDHLTRASFTHLVENYNSATRDHLAPLGFGGPNSLFAMLTQRHAQEHGLERADYGALVTAQRQHAAGNPGAVYRTPLTIDEYLQAPIVADPLCIYDCVPVVTGADALIIKAANEGVAIRSVALSFNPDDQTGDGLTDRPDERGPDAVGPSGRRSGRHGPGHGLRRLSGHGADPARRPRLRRSPRPCTRRNRTAGQHIGRSALSRPGRRGGRPSRGRRGGSSASGGGGSKTG